MGGRRSRRWCALAVQDYSDLRLLVSELVTNSVRHARLGPGDRIRLQVEISDRVLRVEVSDPGEGFVANIPEPGARGPGGWGLFLTERLADRWGVDRDGEWTTVWLERTLTRLAPIPGGGRLARGRLVDELDSLPTPSSPTPD